MKCIMGRVMCRVCKDLPSSCPLQKITIIIIVIGLWLLLVVTNQQREYPKGLQRSGMGAGSLLTGNSIPKGVLA